MRPLWQIPVTHPPRKLRFARDGSRFLAVSLRDALSVSVDGKPDAPPFTASGILFDADYLTYQDIVVAEVSVSEAGQRVDSLACYNLFQQVRHFVTVDGDNECRCVVVDHHNRRIFAGWNTGNIDFLLRVYDLKLTPQLPVDIQFPPFFDMRTDRIGSRLIVSGEWAILLDISGQPRLISKDILKDSDCTGTPCAVAHTDMTPDGRLIVAGLHGGRQLCVTIDAQTGQTLNWYGQAGDEQAYHASHGIALSPDGQSIVVSLERAPQVRVYRVGDGKISHTYPVKAVALSFSPNGTSLAMAAKHGDNYTLEMWPFVG